LTETYSYERNPDYFRRVHGIKGDICEENLGLTPDTWRELSQKIDTIFHCAAAIQFNQPYEKAREINFNGTKRILALALKCHENKVLRRFNHVSTAYVAGKTKRFHETDCDIGQRFSNTYEQTKLEAELEVSKYLEKGLPAIIFRPSIITGNYKTGETVESTMFFVMHQLMLKNKLLEFICNDDSEVNSVPVDYVVESMLHITKSDANVGKTFNLTNGKNNNLKQMITNCCKISQVQPPKIYSIANKHEASAVTRISLSILFDYMEICHTFDDTQAAEALRGSGIACPIIDYGFSERLLAYTKKKYIDLADH
jgi:thioester reductase-like protein